LERRLNPS